jgi:hypothetical protein
MAERPQLRDDLTKTKFFTTKRFTMSQSISS